MEPGIKNITVSGSVNWYTDEFIYNSVVKFLKESGYKIQKDANKESEKEERQITATKFFKKEVIEVKGIHSSQVQPHYITSKLANAKNSVSEGLLSSFINFSLSDNAEVAMAIPNISRYQSILEKLYDYFTFNDLHFRVYLVNEDGTVVVSNLNQKHSKLS